MQSSNAVTLFFFRNVDVTRNSAISDKPGDAFRGQSRSPNMVPFHMLGMVSYKCPIVTLSVIRTVFDIFDFKNEVTMKTWKCHNSIERIRLPIDVL